MARKTINTSKLICTAVSRQASGIEVVAFSTEKGDALFAQDGNSVGHFSINIHEKKNQGQFEPGDTYELTVTHTGSAKGDGNPA